MKLFNLLNRIFNVSSSEKKETEVINQPEEVETTINEADNQPAGKITFASENSGYRKVTINMYMDNCETDQKDPAVKNKYRSVN
jgi:hypothetical protein